jgi:DNA-binding NarL/FixJ family response regulator
MTTTRRRIRVTIVDSNDLARTGCHALLESDSRFEVLASAASLDEIESRLDPDLVILDPSAQGRQDSLLLLATTKYFPSAAILLLTDCCDGDFWVEAFNLGARGLLPKSSSPSWFLLDAAYAVGRRTGLVMEQGLFERVIKERRRKRSVMMVSGMAVKLSPRELEVLNLIAQGLSDDEAALKLGIEKTTIHTHIANALEKAPVSNRLQLGVYALATGLVTWHQTQPT